MPVKILVADDSVTMRKIMEMTFAGEDAQVVAVDSGEAALVKAREIRPDIVFADVSMDGMDGYGLAHAIKSTPTLADAAVILLSSQHHAYDQARGQTAGVDDYVAKPFDTQAVIDKVAQVLSRPRAAAPANVQTAAAAPPAASRPAEAPLRAGGRKATVAFDMNRPAVAAPTPVGRPSGPPAGVQVVSGAPGQPVPASRPAPPPPPAAVSRPPVRAASASPAPPGATVPSPAPSISSAPAVITTGSVNGANNGVELNQRLNELGLTREQIEGVLALSRELVQQVVWEVVPDLAETLIREEIRRLTTE